MFRFALVTVIALCLADPGLADDCQIPAEARGERPGHSDGPTEIRIGMFLVDVVRVNDRDQSITVDFNLNLRWVDPRLARGHDGPPVCVVGTHAIWNPNLRILNQRSLGPQLPDQLRIDRSGRVHYDQRFYGELRAIGDFSEFPFDTRDLRVELVAVDHPPEEVSFVLNEARTGRAETFAVANWSIGGQSIEKRDFELIPGRTFSGVDFVFPMVRRAAYFVWNTIVPLVMIVFMSWCVFWVNPARLGPQLGLSATSMLSLIAYRFTLAGVIPPVPYLTRMDIFLNGASLLVFLALVEAVFSSTVADRGRQALASRIDSLSRVVFPTAFALIILIAFAF